MRLPQIWLDIEPTNRCNAECGFCPRHMTPHEGLMSPETFEAAYQRVVEYQPVVTDVLGLGFEVTMCGLGEPLLNKHTPGWIGRIRDLGLRCSVSSNGALLDEGRGEALLDNRLSAAFLNVGARGEEYEEIYKLPWERTRDNVLRFAEMAEGTETEVHIVLVNHQADHEEMKAMAEYWTDQGLSRFVRYDLQNRGGALVLPELFVEDDALDAEAARLLAEQAATTGNESICGAPLLFPFIGYDGNYYLCCSDWTKAAPMGTVATDSLVDITRAKLDHVRSRAHPCDTCNLDPQNRVRHDLVIKGPKVRARRTERTMADLAESAAQMGELVDALEPLAPKRSTVRRRIPVRKSTEP